MERQPQYVVIVPVKAPAVGKSRLQVPDAMRRDLATAFAMDVLRTAVITRGVAQVVVVTDDPGIARTAAAALGVTVAPDGADLNDGLVAAAAAVRSSFPEAVPVAVCADLPCLTAVDLGAALAQVRPDRACFVADAEGTGTTMYAAPYDAFAPRFGAGSRQAHRDAGAVELTGELATLRLDVDDAAALATAASLGPGGHTRAVLGMATAT